MKEVNENVLGCFWLPPKYHNTSISGANRNTIKCLSGESKDYYSHKYFERVTLPQILKDNIPYPTNMKKLPKSKSYGCGYREIVNDALNQIRKNRKGYVFTVDQLKEVIRFFPDINVSYDDDIYFIWGSNNQNANKSKQNK